jgi:hypothetical protein
MILETERVKEWARVVEDVAARYPGHKVLEITHGQQLEYELWEMRKRAEKAEAELKRITIMNDLHADARRVSVGAGAVQA